MPRRGQGLLDGFKEPFKGPLKTLERAFKGLSKTF